MNVTDFEFQSPKIIIKIEFLTYFPIVLFQHRPPPPRRTESPQFQTRQPPPVDFPLIESDTSIYHGNRGRNRVKIAIFSHFPL